MGPRRNFRSPVRCRSPASAAPCRDSVVSRHRERGAVLAGCVPATRTAGDAARGCLETSGSAGPKARRGRRRTSADRRPCATFPSRRAPRRLPPRARGSRAPCSIGGPADEHQRRHAEDVAPSARDGAPRRPPSSVRSRPGARLARVGAPASSSGRAGPDAGAATPGRRPHRLPRRTPCPKRRAARRSLPGRALLRRRVLDQRPVHAHGRDSTPVRHVPGRVERESLVGAARSARTAQPRAAPSCARGGDPPTGSTAVAGLTPRSSSTASTPPSPPLRRPRTASP